MKKDSTEQNQTWRSDKERDALKARAAGSSAAAAQQVAQANGFEESVEKSLK